MNWAKGNFKMAVECKQEWGFLTNVFFIANMVSLLIFKQLNNYRGAQKCSNFKLYFNFLIQIIFILNENIFLQKLD